jgi:hypothetical protein
MAQRALITWQINLGDEISGAAPTAISASLLRNFSTLIWCTVISNLTRYDEQGLLFQPHSGHAESALSSWPKTSK